MTVATTRPETMLGDTAVAVHPEDERYKAMVGKKILLPLIGREIPIIADDSVDPEFGTGAVKITPAHDFNDFEMGRRHNLAQISVMDTHARMNAEAGPYRGMTREECRRKVVEDLTALGLLEKIEPHQHEIGVCSRCDTVVEPMLSDQWFVRVTSRGADAGARGGARRPDDLPSEVLGEHLFRLDAEHPGLVHLAPALVGPSHSRLLVRALRRDDGRGRAPAACAKCGGGDLRQEEDVLDTWFSRGCGRSRPWDGPTRPPSSSATTRPAC